MHAPLDLLVRHAPRVIAACCGLLITAPSVSSFADTPPDGAPVEPSPEQAPPPSAVEAPPVADGVAPPPASPANPVAAEPVAAEPVSAAAKPAPAAPEIEASAVRWHAGLASGVGLDTPDFGLSLGVLGQLGYEVAVPPEGDATHGFSVWRARPNLRFQAFDGLITTFVQAELAGTPALLDFQLGIHPLPEFGFTVGQFITPHSRGFMTPVPKLSMPDFGPVESEFRAGRDVGLSIDGALFDGWLEYDAGLFDGNGLAGRFGAGYMAMGRLVLNPFGPTPYDETYSLSKPDAPFKLAVGWNGYARVREREDAATQRDLVMGPELFIVVQGFTFLAEGYRRERKEAGAVTEAWGGYAQAGYFVVPQWVELAARVGALDLDFGAPTGKQATYEGGLNVYPVGNHLKVQLRYANTRGDTPPAAEHRVTIQTQLQL